MQKSLFRLTLLAMILLALTGCANREAAPAAQRAAPTVAPAPEKSTPASEAAAGKQAESAVPGIGGDPALLVEQVESIKTYRMSVQVFDNGSPSVNVEVNHIKEPLAEDDYVTLIRGEKRTTANVRYIDNVLYLNNGEKWAVIGQFNLAELTIVTPAGMADAAPLLALVGREEVSGRQTIHLRGDKETIPPIQIGAEYLSVKTAENAQLDLWLDVEQRFIVKLDFSLTLEGKTFTTKFLYYDFNAPLVVEAPTNVE